MDDAAKIRASAARVADVAGDRLAGELYLMLSASAETALELVEQAIPADRLLMLLGKEDEEPYADGGSPQRTPLRATHHSQSPR